MPITSLTSDPASLSLTVVGEYPVPVDRLWEAYADARQLERFWGPVDWPAKFSQHDVEVGGMSRYTMTGPDGTKAGGWWRFIAVERPRLMEIEDGFATPDGAPDPAMPTMRMRFDFASTAAGSRITMVTRFPSVAAMEQIVGMGMEDGLRSAMGQLDSVLQR